MSSNNLLEDKQEIMKVRIYCKSNRKMYYIEIDKNDTIISLMNKFLKQFEPESIGLDNDCVCSIHKVLYNHYIITDFTASVIKYYEYGSLFHVTVKKKN